MEALTKLRVEWAVASRNRPGEQVCGDSYLFKPLATGALICAVDGLGHGREAARAAALAVGTIDHHGEEPVDSLVRRCHRTLAGSHGVTMTLAKIQIGDRNMSWLGVGNVAGAHVRATTGAVAACQSLPLHPGVVGSRREPALRPHRISLEVGDVILLATDGIRGGFADGILLKNPVQKIADEAMERHRVATDDALILVARYLGGKP